MSAHVLLIVNSPLKSAGHKNELSAPFLCMEKPTEKKASSRDARFWVLK